jgi:hypothetical protein
MRRSSYLKKKNKPKVIYFYKELFRLTYEKTFAFFLGRWKSGRNTIKPIEKSLVYVLH